MTQCEKRRYIKRLAQFKKDYNFTSKEIAQELETTEAAVSHWFSGGSLPRLEKIKQIQKLFYKYCIPGIIKIPKNEHWSAPFFLRVDDIKNPYKSYQDDGWSGEEPQVFSEWVKDWSRAFPNPEIFRTYETSSIGRAKCHLDCLNLNTTIEHADYFIGQIDFEHAILHHQISRPDEYDYELAQSLTMGELDGTT